MIKIRKNISIDVSEKEFFSACRIKPEKTKNHLLIIFAREKDLERKDT